MQLYKAKFDVTDSVSEKTNVDGYYGEDGKVYLSTKSDINGLILSRLGVNNAHLEKHNLVLSSDKLEIIQVSIAQINPDLVKILRNIREFDDYNAGTSLHEFMVTPDLIEDFYIEDKFPKHQEELAVLSAMGKHFAYIHFCTT